MHTMTRPATRRDPHSGRDPVRAALDAMWATYADGWEARRQLLAIVRSAREVSEGPDDLQSRRAEVMTLCSRMRDAYADARAKGALARKELADHPPPPPSMAATMNQQAQRREQQAQQTIEALREGLCVVRNACAPSPLSQDIAAALDVVQDLLRSLDTVKSGTVARWAGAQNLHRALGLLDAACNYPDRGFVYQASALCGAVQLQLAGAEGRGQRGGRPAGKTDAKKRLVMDLWRRRPTITSGQVVDALAQRVVVSDRYARRVLQELKKAGP